jgi:hypothetical protein
MGRARDRADAAAIETESIPAMPTKIESGAWGVLVTGPMLPP